LILLISTSQVAGIIGMYNHAYLKIILRKNKIQNTTYSPQKQGSPKERVILIQVQRGNGHVHQILVK
jgi:hypothetical protein